MEIIKLGELLTFILVAIALSMDSFSISIGLGMRGIRLRNIAKISVVNGAFHVIMPLLGMVLGHILSVYMGDIAVLIGGALLILFGLHMIYSSFLPEESSLIGTTFWGIILFSLSVSFDAFSVGLSFGLFSVNTMLMLICIGISATLFTGLGLYIGRGVSGWLGQYGEVLGGIILVIFGIKFLV